MAPKQPQQLETTDSNRPGQASNLHITGIIAKGNYSELFHLEHKSIFQKQITFTPWLILSEPKMLDGAPTHHYERRELTGNGAYRHLVHLNHPLPMLAHLRKQSQINNAGKRSLYHDGRVLILGREEQFLIQRRLRMFSDLEFSDLRRFQFDLETEGLDPQTGSILVIAMSDTTGWVNIVHAGMMSEREMIEAFMTAVIERNPDVLEGHNILGFDFEFLVARAHAAGISLKLGRNGEELYQFNARWKVADRSPILNCVDVPGRIVADTMLAAEQFDAAARKCESYRLKDLAIFYGIAPPARTYIAGDEIAEKFRSDPESVLAYARDDIEEVRCLSEIVHRGHFELTKQLPASMSKVMRSGPSRHIELAMIEEYYLNRMSLPAKPEKDRTFKGGEVRLFRVGIQNNVLSADAEAMYPSIIVGNKIKPAGDEGHVFVRLVKRFLAERLREKSLAAAAPKGSVERTIHVGRSAALKILVNSAYGYLGTGGNLFSDVSAAEEVTRIGREALGLLMRVAEENGATLIEADTDGVLLTPPAEYANQGRHAEFVKILAARMPAWMKLKHDGSWDAMLSIAKKSYALLDCDGGLVVKGGALRSRQKALFIRDFLKRAIMLILRDDLVGLRRFWLETLASLRKGVVQVESLASRTRLSSTVAEYRANRKIRHPQFEAALDGKPEARKGDVIAFYRALPRPGLSDWRMVKDFENDLDGRFYEMRLRTSLKALKPAFRRGDFDIMFCNDSIPAEAAEKISTRSAKVPPEPIPGVRAWIEVAHGIKERGSPVREWIDADDPDAVEQFFDQYSRTGVFISLFRNLTSGFIPGKSDGGNVLEDGPIPFEFEKDPTPEGIQIALDASRSAVRYLEHECGIPPEVIRRIFNGKKSFWVYIPREVFDLPPLVRLHRHCDAFARHIATKLPPEHSACMDFNIYKFRGLHRPVGVRYPKHGWTVQLTTEQHRDLTLDEIVQLSMGGEND